MIAKIINFRSFFTIFALMSEINKTQHQRNSQSRDASTNNPGATRMQVLIVAYGKRGIESVAAMNHPRVEGVEYIVSWQYGHDESTIPTELKERSDFRILPSPTSGVATNRNLALNAADAPLVLFSDDDVSYTPQQLESVIKAFEERPDCGFLTFKYHSSEYPREYPPCEMDLAHISKGYYLTGFEMAFRLADIRRHGIQFNELFGIAAPFPACEEDLFMHDVLKAGIKARFVPITIVTHEGDTTGMRRQNDPDFIRTIGAVHSIINPLTWPARMIVHTLRRKHLNFKEKLRFCYYWADGVRLLRRLRKKSMNDRT